MKFELKIFVLFAVLTSHAAFASDCALVKKPLSSSEMARVLGPISGLYEDTGAREVTRKDGTITFGKHAILISPEGVKVGVTIYPKLHEPYVDFEIDAEFSAEENRISAPINELDGAIALEHIGEQMCHVVTIKVKDNELCRSPLVSSTHGITDMDNLKRCARYSKTK